MHPLSHEVLMSQLVPQPESHEESHERLHEHALQSHLVLSQLESHETSHSALQLDAPHETALQSQSSVHVDEPHACSPRPDWVSGTGSLNASTSCAPIATVTARRRIM